MTAERLADRLRDHRGDGEALWQICLPVLKSDDWQARKVAVNALARCPETDVLLPHLLDAVRDQEDAGLRNAALEVLERIGSSVVPTLVGQLDRADAETQKFLVDVLGLIGSPIAVPRLTSLLKSGDPNLRFAATEALGKMASPFAAEALFQHLRRVRDATEVFVLLQALTHCAEIHAITDPPMALLDHLRADPLLTRPLLNLLHALDAPEADRFLWDWLRDFDRMRLQEVAKFLGSLDPIALRQKCRRLGLPEVRAGAEDVRSLLGALDPEVRAGAVWLAVWADAVDTLVDPFYGGRLDESHLLAAAPCGRTDAFAGFFRHRNRLDQEQLATLIRLVGAIGDTRNAEVLEEAADAHASLRPLAFRWGAELGRTRVLDWLEDLLARGEDIDLIAAGLQALLPAHHQQIVDVLAPWSERIEASNEWRSFLILVERLNLVELRGRVELAWRRADPELRAAALNVLARFRLDVARRYLRLALSDESEIVRLAASEILADLADPDSEREVRSLLVDRTPWIRAEALRTMLRLQGDGALDHFLAALKDPEDVVQIQAIRALRAIAYTDAADAMRRLSRSASVDVAAEALRFCQIVGLPPRADDLAFLTHGSWRVRLEAILWLATGNDFLGQLREHLYHEDDPDVLALGMKAVAS